MSPPVMWPLEPRSTAHPEWSIYAAAPRMTKPSQESAAADSVAPPIVVVLDQIDPKRHGGVVGGIMQRHERISAVAATSILAVPAVDLAGGANWRIPEIGHNLGRRIWHELELRGSAAARQIRFKRPKSIDSRLRSRP